MELAFDIIPAFREFGVVPGFAVPAMLYALDYPDNFDVILQRADHRMEAAVPSMMLPLSGPPTCPHFVIGDLPIDEERTEIHQRL